MDRYFRGKLVLAELERVSYKDMAQMQDVLQVKIMLDGEEKPFVWSSNKHEPLTTEVPRKYRKHVNQQLLEDLNNDS